ncbi:uncharacterized protein isoform X3 [Macaca fascicularis]|uniref:uncharacterized protein isoform X3 n=1 Tax=Macaca fascicularis TaxID=9541 RepID=UPI003D15CB45
MGEGYAGELRHDRAPTSFSHCAGSKEGNEVHARRTAPTIQVTEVSPGLGELGGGAAYLERTGAVPRGTTLAPAQILLLCGLPGLPSPPPGLLWTDASQVRIPVAVIGHSSFVLAAGG